MQEQSRGARVQQWAQAGMCQTLIASTVHQNGGTETGSPSNLRNPSSPAGFKAERDTPLWFGGVQTAPADAHSRAVFGTHSRAGLHVLFCIWAVDTTINTHSWAAWKSRGARGASKSRGSPTPPPPPPCFHPLRNRSAKSVPRFHGRKQQQQVPRAQTS